MSISHIGALIVTQPDEAKRLVLGAIIEAEGDRKKAAKVLGTTHRSFYRFIEKLHLGDEIDRIIDAEGFHRIPGPARSTERIKAAFMLAKGSLDGAAKKMGIKPEALQSRIQELSLWGELEALIRTEKWKCPPLRRKSA
jgi:transcriptional regulator with GAF, ATPase, and Fis domain